jgi:hypothetical protein
MYVEPRQGQKPLKVFLRASLYCCRVNKSRQAPKMYMCVWIAGGGIFPPVVSWKKLVDAL